MSEGSPALDRAGLDEVRFGADGLVPAVVQDRATREVLMVGFMNREALARTLASGDAWFWSRTRGELWHKGATSGNYLRVREVRRNCEDSTLLLLADPAGPTCHTGARTCYYRTLDGRPVSGMGAGEQSGPGGGAPGGEDSPSPRRGEEGDLDWLFEILRQPVRREGSYTGQLLAAGVDRIGRKIGEEAAEVIIAAKNRSPEELAAETADLWYHSLVLLLEAGLEPEDVYRVLRLRHRQKTGSPE
jgi:phosphoribosyl-AMP cyclohydrolase / phosphoribosyl-ATP pyrophosphohydrolase